LVEPEPLGEFVPDHAVHFQLQLLSRLADGPLSTVLIKPGRPVGPAIPENGIAHMRDQFEC
jgi:hypothetical protein